MSVQYFETVSSTFDAAFDLAEKGALKVWDSVQADLQTSGRGQLRRSWLGRVGNIYASIRLPLENPFSSTAGAVATSVLCLEALASEGFELALKWPNDLARESEGHLFKIGGILLEERNGILIAGIGINLDNAPDSSAFDRVEALVPASLAQLYPDLQMPTPQMLWLAMAKFMRTAWQTGSFREDWWKEATFSLVWRHEQVRVSDGSRQAQGALMGIAENGGCILETDNGARVLTSGTMRKIVGPN